MSATCRSHWSIDTMPTTDGSPPRPVTTIARPVKRLSRGRLYLNILGAVLMAGLIGYGFGWYRAYPAEHQRDVAVVRVRLSEARARALDGAVSIYRTNWGDAGTHLQEGLRLLETFKATGQDQLSPEHSAKVDEAAQLLREARDLSGQTSLDASSRAERASNLLHEVFRGMPDP